MPRERELKAGDVGQLFGVTLGDRPANGTSPNIYFSATSAYGLHLVKRRADGTLERMTAGGPGAMWAPGQFGLGLQGGPGAIYVLDGGTGAVNLLTNVMLDGVPNPGPGLGAIAYDREHKQIFATDLYTGMIHRIGLDGAELGRLDHGAKVRAAAQLPPVAFDPGRRMNIASPTFRTDDPATWSLAPPARRVWAVAVDQSRLYYSVEEGLQIWSVGIGPTGDFADDARFEAVVPDHPGPYPVTDIAFAGDGAMVVAQRSAFGTGHFGYSAFTRGGEPRVLRFIPRRPDDQSAPGNWKLDEPKGEYAIGFAGTMRNANGGVAFGYGYDPQGKLNLGACRATLLATGDNLRANPSLQDRLTAGGPAAVHGIQLNPVTAQRDPNFPQPWTSRFVDFDDRHEDADRLGSMGQVRVLEEPCAPASPAPGIARSTPTRPTAEPPFTFLEDPQCPGPGCVTDCGGAACQPCLYANAPDGFCPPPGQPIDLAIRKTGATSPAPHVNGYSFNLAVTSVTGVYPGAGLITVTDTVPPGMTFTAATGTNWACASLPAVQNTTVTCTYTGPGPTAPGQSLGSIAITATATGPRPYGPYRNCARVGVPLASGLMDIEPANNVSCITVRKPTDVAIRKTGELKEGPAVTGASFNLAVTNVGVPFAGANVIQVTDVVPPGMTFTAATGTNWTCATLPAVQNTTVTCTYTGPGPTAPGQSLGNIAITATTTGNGPWENCAVVGILPASGVTDANAANNKDCATLKKPPKPNDVTVQKISPSGNCAVDSPCTFQIKVTNNSPWPFNGPVTIADNSGTTMPILSSNLPCTTQPSQIPFSCSANVNLPAGPSSQTYTIVAYIPNGTVPTVQGGVLLENCASISNAPPTPGFPSTITTTQNNCTKYVACGFQCHMRQYEIDSLSIVKKADSTQCSPGGMCSYTFTISNSGTTMFAGPVSFIDTMPAGASTFLPPPTPAPWSCLPFAGSPDQTKCLIRPANIPAGGSISVTVKFQISPNYTQSTLTNCSEFFAGTSPSTMRRAAAPFPQNYGMKNAEDLRAYLEMRGLAQPGAQARAAAPNAAPGAAPALASVPLPTLGPDDRSCTTVNITQPPPAPNTGDITIKKQVVNNTPGVIPATTTYAVAVTCGATTTNLSLLDNGTSTISNIPLNSSCTVTETPPVPPAICGPVLAQWATAITPPTPVTITGPGTTIVVKNTLSCVTHPPGTGRVLIKKVVEAQMPTSMTFPVSVSCTDGSTHNVGVTSTLDAEISPLPLTASCTATEGTVPVPANTCPVGKRGSWTTTYAPSQTVPVSANATITVKNKLDCVDVVQPAQLLTPPVLPPPVRPPSVNTGSDVCPPGMIRRGRQCIQPPPPSCRAPMVANADGTCACPQGTVRRGQRCIEPPVRPVCKAPLVERADGSCACPAGTIRRGQRCIEPPSRPVCRAPLVERADGSCACPAGTIQRGRQCVRPVVCEAPARPTASGACACPKGMVPRGRGCVARERPIRDVIIPGVIQVLPHLLGPRGGDRPPRGGDVVPRGVGRP